MSFKICVTKIPQREKKKGRKNIFRDNSSEFSKKKSNNGIWPCLSQRG